MKFLELFSFLAVVQLAWSLEYADFDGCIAQNYEAIGLTINNVSAKLEKLTSVNTDIAPNFYAYLDWAKLIRKASKRLQTSYEFRISHSSVISAVETTKSVIVSFKNMYTENVTNSVMDARNNFSQQLAFQFDDLRFRSSSDDFYRTCLDETFGNFKETASKMVSEVKKCLAAEEKVLDDKIVKVEELAGKVKEEMASLVKGLKDCPVNGKELACIKHQFKVNQLSQQANLLEQFLSNANSADLESCTTNIAVKAGLKHLLDFRASFIDLLTKKGALITPVTVPKELMDEI